MIDEDPKIIRSPSCQRFTADGMTVSVEIYKLEESDGWALEVVDKDNTSTVWKEPFATDRAAWDEFVLGVRTYGLTKLLQADDDEPVTIH